MSVKTILMTGAAATMILTASLQAKAEDAKPAFTPEQKTAIEDMVRDFIMDNPEVLIKSVNQMHEKEAQKREDDAKQALKENADFFFKNKMLPEVGNPEGSVAIVEFFDFNCHYCKEALKAVQKTIENDKDVRVIFVDLPILSPQSEMAAKWALAANKQGKYWEFHQAVLEDNAPKTDENLEKLAKSVGLDIKQLKKDVDGEDIQKELDANREAAKKLQVTGTPGFIVGDQIIRGYVPYEGFKTIIDDVRNDAKK